MLVSGTILCGVYMFSFLYRFVLQTTAKWSLLLHLLHPLLYAGHPLPFICTPAKP